MPFRLGSVSSIGECGCSPIVCDIEGIFSINFSSSTRSRVADCGEDNTDLKYLPGAAVGTVSLSAWAFSKNDSDKWLGSRCRGSAQGSQSNIQRFDYGTKKWWIIPTKMHGAQIVGDLTAASLGQVFFTGTAADTQINNGIVLGYQMQIQMGAELSIKAGAFDINLPDLDAYNIEPIGVEECYLNSVSASVDYPNPATITVSYDFMLKQSID